MIRLRNAVDSELAKFEEDDELQATLGSPMDDVTEQLQKLDAWIKDMGPLT